MPPEIEDELNTGTKGIEFKVTTRLKENWKRNEKRRCA